MKFQVYHGYSFQSSWKRFGEFRDMVEVEAKSMLAAASQVIGRARSYKGRRTFASIDNPGKLAYVWAVRPPRRVPIPIVRGRSPT